MNKIDFMARLNKNFWALAKDKADDKTANLYIYSDVQADGYDWWTDREIKSETSAQHFREELDKLGDVEQINIYINSKGGDVCEGLGIYSQLRRHKAHKTAYIDGFACSIASVIPMACDEIVISPPAVMMIHPAWSIAVGNAEELRKAADDLDQITESIKLAYLDRAGDKISDKELSKLMKAESWLTSSDCLKYGFADKISGDSKNPEDVGNTDKSAEPEKPDEPVKGDDPEEKNEKDKTEFTAKALSIIGNIFV